MSISDTADQSPELDAVEAAPTGSKRTCVVRPDEEWARIRARYETAERTVGLRALAKEYEIPVSTVMKRAWREGWKQSKGLCLQARKIVEAATLTALESRASVYGERAADNLLEQLQPIIEREKAAHTKSQILRSNGHLDRLDKFLKRKNPLDPRDEAHLAKAVSTHVSDLRRTLGMGDSGGLSGSLSLNILTGSAAIQINQGQADQG